MTPRIVWISLVALVAASCSGAPTGPSSTTAAGGDGSARAGVRAVPVNSDHPGTGNNAGLGAPNSCTDNAPTIQEPIGSNLEYIKAEVNDVAGLERGYRWRWTRKDANKSPLSFMDNSDGREIQYRLPRAPFEPGQWLAEVQPRRVGCPQEFGTWSKPLEFSVKGDPVHGPATPAKHWYPKDPGQ